MFDLRKIINLGPTLYSFTRLEIISGTLLIIRLRYIILLIINLGFHLIIRQNRKRIFLGNDGSRLVSFSSSAVDRTTTSSEIIK